MTREEILAVYAQGPEAVVTLVTMLLERLAHVEARLAAVEAQLAKDSHTSGKPPSSDPVRRPRSLREQSGKRPGGQPGHEGTTLGLRATPDVVLTPAPAQCHACGTALPAAAVDAAAGVERRQVFDLTPPRLVVAEHRAVEAQCPACGAWTWGACPPDVRTTAQSGPELQALAVYLTTQQLLPVARASEMLAHLTGQPVSVATVLAAEQRAAAALTPVMAHIRTGLLRRPVLGVDETGVFISRRQWWLHPASTPTLTHYTVHPVHPQRGRSAHAAIGILPAFRGTAVHDGFQAYGTADAPTYAGRHALYGVHLLRELTFLAEEYHRRWAAALKRSLLTRKAAVARATAAGRSTLDRATLRRYWRRYATLLAEGEAAEPPPTRVGPTKGKLKRTPAGRLLFRLRRDRTWVRRFLEDVAVPFDNNEAERNLRMMKVEQKVSGGFRTPTGAATFCTLRGYVVTARKQGRTALDALRDLFAGHPLTPAVPE